VSTQFVSDGQLPYAVQSDGTVWQLRRSGNRLVSKLPPLSGYIILPRQSIAISPFDLSVYNLSNSKTIPVNYPKAIVSLGFRMELLGSSSNRALFSYRGLNGSGVLQLKGNAVTIKTPARNWIVNSPFTTSGRTLKNMITGQSFQWPKGHSVSYRAFGASKVVASTNEQVLCVDGSNYIYSFAISNEIVVGFVVMKESAYVITLQSNSSIWKLLYITKRGVNPVASWSRSEFGHVSIRRTDASVVVGALSKSKTLFWRRWERGRPSIQKSRSLVPDSRAWHVVDAGVWSANHFGDIVFQKF
jgi:hypothetical protein